jgi:hypothetical protein
MGSPPRQKINSNQILNVDVPYDSVIGYDFAIGPPYGK